MFASIKKINTFVGYFNVGLNTYVFKHPKYVIFFNLIFLKIKPYDKEI
jgi:hypothetical protein